MLYNINMNIQIRNKTKHHEYDVYFPLLQKYAEETLRLTKRKGEYAISLTLVGPRTIRRINREYRNLDRVTDVISFAIQDDTTVKWCDSEIDLGDVFINVRRVREQAHEYGHSEKREFIFLFVHGLLHCLGYDHMTLKDEKVMFSLQRKILGDLQ